MEPASILEWLNGTGVYIGMAERDGAAVVCHKCKGTGCFDFRNEYEPFEARKRRDGIERVYEINPGICVGAGKDSPFNLYDFGGISYEDWLDGTKFRPGTEMRDFTCPAWWFQSSPSAERPEWKECGWGRFSECQHFDNKSECWQKWDESRKADVTA